MDVLYPSLLGASVLVTGGATGIGEAFVQSFAGQGARVAFVDIQGSAGRELALRIQDAGREARFIEHDIKDVSGYAAMLDGVIDTHGPPTVLVNNAASDRRVPLADVGPADWDDSFALNIRPHFFLAQAVAPLMALAGKGSIINVGSISWRVKGADLAAYQAAKAGIEGLTRALARDLGPDNIRVNCIAPGMVRTERQAQMWKGTDKFESYLERQCLKSAVLPDDIARAALWLASDESRAVTAQTLIVDGGAS